MLNSLLGFGLLPLSAGFVANKIILVGDNSAGVNVRAATKDMLSVTAQLSARVDEESREFVQALDERTKNLNHLGMAVVDIETSGKTADEICEMIKEANGVSGTNINCVVDQFIQLGDPKTLQRNYETEQRRRLNTKMCPGDYGDDMCEGLLEGSYCKYWQQKQVCQHLEKECYCTDDTEDVDPSPGDDPMDVDDDISNATDDPLWMKQWGMHNIKLDGAWNLLSRGSDETIVAVIDTGVDIEHEDLDQNIWVNWEEYNGTPGVDDDGNGYVDDYFGWNFVDDNNDARDDNMHGTHCAGVIGALQNNGVGVAGINGDVKIMALKFLSGSGGGSLTGAIEAIDYAIMMGAHVASNSWGGGFLPPVLNDAVQRATNSNMLFVAAAGNEGSNNDWYPSGPCNADTCLCVASTDRDDTLSFFSNFGTSHVHVAAPGSDILSTVPTFSDPSGYEAVSGTSMACPAVSGLAALLRSEMIAAGDLEPDMEVVREVILETTRPVAGLENAVFTGGVIDIDSAVKMMRQRLGA